jgi:long-chain acyl-CoA synthetase
MFLPLAHVLAREVAVGALATRTIIGHTPDIKNLVADLGVFRPTFVLAVPRVFEKVYNQAEAKAEAGGKGAIFQKAAQVAIDWSRAQDTGGPGLLLRGKHMLFDKLVYSKLRAALGGRCVAAVSGGAPLGDRLGHFFRGIGVTIFEGYGLTETFAAASVNHDGAFRMGTVGRPLPGVTFRIADDGEVLIRGGIVMRGYWNNEDATKEAIDGEGFFHTGDIGEIDAAVKDANKAVSNAEAIKKFKILGTDFTEENGMLTPSLKLKRSVVMKEFDDEVEKLYSR